jgi:hypothetical protein
MWRYDSARILSNDFTVADTKRRSWNADERKSKRMRDSQAKPNNSTGPPFTTATSSTTFSNLRKY